MPDRTLHDTTTEPAPLWLPVGELADHGCQVEDEHGEQSCRVRAGWRITVVTVEPLVARDVGKCGRAVTEPPARSADRWLVCTPHLGLAIVYAEQTYGSALLVEVWHG